MDIKSYISAGRRLDDWIRFSIANRSYTNPLCIKREDSKVNLDTPIYLLMDEHLSETRKTTLYNELFNNGYSLFISIHELADVIETLAEQRPYYNNDELVESINYYFENRDFLEFND